MNDLQSRIGTVLPDGKRVWPKRTLLGRRYELPAPAVTGLDATHFVVLDNKFPDDYDLPAELAKLRAQIGSADAAPAAGGRKAKAEAPVDGPEKP